MTQQERISDNGISKIERYKWTTKDKPGVFLEIPKNQLLIDDAYQRLSREKKILSMANSWSWIACGAIIVADRDGTFYVIDGQHRVLAARKRADINTMPCIVFESTGQVLEAEGFLSTNTLRKPMTGIEKFRAQVITGDPAALLVRKLCKNIGREISDGPGARSVRCVRTLMAAAQSNPEALERILPLVDKAAGEEIIKEKLVDGLFYIETHMPKGTSLTDSGWHQRVLKVGGPNLIEAANKASAFYAHGGAKVWADGMVNAINHNHRKRLVIVGSND